MALIPFGPYAPDLPDVLNEGLTEATNVYPFGGAYKPFPGQSVFSDALTARCQGAITFTAKDGTVETFAGDATKLYRLSGSSFSDVSNGTYATGASDRWRFAVFGDFCVATNGVDTPQKFDVTSDVSFSDITGAPTARFPIVIRDSLVMLDLTDGSGNHIEFSAVNDLTKWTVDCGAGAQELADGGPVRGGTSGEVGFIFQEDAIRLMQFVGGDLRYRFDVIEGASGCIAAGSIVHFQGRGFYLSENGFEFFDGAQSTPISATKLTRTFFDDLDRSNIHNLQGAVDLKNHSVVWAYPTTDAGTGEQDKILIYNFLEDRWSTAEVTNQTIFADDNSGAVLAGFDSNNKMVRYTGSNLAATLTTGDRRFFGDGRKGHGVGATAFVDGNHEVSIGVRDDLQSDPEFVSKGHVKRSGVTNIRAQGRYFRIKTEIPAGESWTEAVGLDLEGVPGGRQN